MKINVNIEAASVAELAEIGAAFASMTGKISNPETSSQIVVEAEDPQPVKRTRQTRKPKDEAPTAKHETSTEGEPMPEELAAQVPDDEPEDNAEDNEYSIQDAVKAATKMASAGKNAAIREALSKLDVRRVSQLKPEQVGAFMAALEEADADA